VRSASRRDLIYSDADFDVFPRRGDTLHRRGEIWHGGRDLRAKFHPHRCSDKGVGPQKLKFVLRFDQNVEYKRPAVSLARFSQNLQRLYPISGQVSC